MNIAVKPDLEARVDQALDRDGMIAACQEVIRVPSLSYEEQAVGLVYAAHLRKLGFDEVEIDGNGNVVGRLRGAGNGPSLMINGHIDHVPAGEMADPHSGAIVDAARWGETGQAIYGRGTCDMKCNVMASAYAVAAIRQAGINLNGDIVFVADVAEEVDSPTGVVSVIERGIRADYGLNTESSRGHVHIGHRGKIDVELEVHGRTSHASEPGNGLNAAFQAVPLLKALEAYAGRLGTDELLGPATVTVISVRTTPDNGTAVVPDRCIVRVDRRYVRGETAESCEAELRALIDQLAQSVPGFRYDFRLMTHYPLMYVAPDNPVVAAALAARQSATGKDNAPAAWRFGVNGTFMCRAGIPTVGLGPGNEKWAHTPDEHILIEDLTETCRIWTRFILRVCGVASAPT
ncbi:M20 family metallopeptidase [Aestuariivirga sp. YIM B02566]|uniref:M20/M25/M40 family metallo-hydrolase n=1 Tax=Taklimakanibacter albus TaxID=2800327 RepID=A0ACC5RDC1_9HYPH|nr:M20/M25/M40 family metallo-hydrolase [Aestuariivirga sp. YIM B02566]MBK1870665.1 M20/M25/M40 family metallo-hydrolase [Aestuariivirga sp. YIM B02566]